MRFLPDSMSKNNSIYIIPVFLLVLLLTGCGKNTPDIAAPPADGSGASSDRTLTVFVGEVPIREYAVTYEQDAQKALCRTLADYIAATTGEDALPVRKASAGDAPTIVLRLDEALEENGKKISVSDGNLTIAGQNPEALEKAVCLFLDTCLGWYGAGTGDAHISTPATSLHIPANWESAADAAWIPEREPIITLWNVNYARGTYLDADVCLNSQILYFTQDQLYEYVKMMKFCGFTGIQVTDMCAAWAGLGGYEAVHEKIRFLADAAHALDMRFTLWVWGAEFADNGWTDPDAVYRSDYAVSPWAYESPKALATYEKYYDIYAGLADCCDRVIGHYHDPGQLSSAEDIAFFAKMLRDKFLAVNPDIDFGISCWVDIYDKATYVRELGCDLTLYGSGYYDEETGYVGFRDQVSRLDCRLGTWAWNTCEMEIDQLASMYFTPNIIRETYQRAKQYDFLGTPEYWSEMDSYHILNLFSLYCAGQLLIDPELSDEELYERLCTAVVGPEYASRLAGILSLVQDARSGASMATYRWESKDYLLTSDDYPAAEILARCDEAIPALQEMIDSGLESYSMPVPFRLCDVLKMMLPHLEQIRKYAEFRIGYQELLDAFAAGESREAVSTRLDALSVPIPNYNTVIGTWGQIEARAQFALLEKFCEENGFETPIDPTLEKERKDRILASFAADQRGRKTPVIFYPGYYQNGQAFGQKETSRLIGELIDEGLVTRFEDGGVALTNWEKYRFHFN